MGSAKEGGESGDGEKTGESTSGFAQASDQAQKVPTSFKEMFQFNSSVMGFSDVAWMQEVLDVFDTIVQNVKSSSRLEEEATILVLRITKVTTGQINLGDFKACMLGTMRSMMPK